MKLTRLKSKGEAQRYLESLPAGDWREDWNHLPGTFTQGDSTFTLNGRPVLRIKYRALKAEVYRIDSPLPLVRTGPGGDFHNDLTADQL